MQDVTAQVEAFYDRPGPWHDELRALRAILLSCPVTEEFKWRAPCYTAHGGNIAIVGGFKAFCVLSFFKGVLMKDPKGILVPPGENSRSGRIIKFTNTSEIVSREATLRAYVIEAVGVEKAGHKVNFPKDDLPYPDELAARLKTDVRFRTAFEALTPGRQRGYVLYFSQPVQSTTRVSRIEKALPGILAGKGFQGR